MTALPCTTNPRLYDTASDNDTPDRKRAQAIQQATALCATCPAPCEQKVTGDNLPAMPGCPAPSYASYVTHKKRGEDACEGCKAKKRAYNNDRYARNPQRARAPQRAYEARQRAAARGKAVE